MSVWKNLTFGTVHAFGLGESPTSGTFNEDNIIEWDIPKDDKMKVKRLHEDALLPTKAHEGDLGYDLYSVGPTQIGPGATMTVRTGVAIQFPEGYGGIVKDRSSVSTKLKLFTVAGVIDNGYTGEIHVAIHNASGFMQVIGPGQKIAQLVLIPVTNFQIEEADDIETTDGRGQDGFGSTGE
jgi:dUTP pyrophosphatase